MRIIINLLCWSVSCYAASSSVDKELRQIGLPQKAHPYLGIYTPAHRAYGTFESVEQGMAYHTIVSTAMRGILPERAFEAAEALATIIAPSVDEFGNQSLQILQELQKEPFALNPLTCSVVQLLLTSNTTRVRSCTYTTAEDSSGLYPHPYQATLRHRELSAISFSDAIEITVQAAPLTTSADEHAQVTCVDNPLRIVVNLEAWHTYQEPVPTKTVKKKHKNPIGCSPS